MNMILRDEMERLNIQEIPGMGLFCLDFSIFHPFENQNKLDVDVSLSTEPMENGIIYNLRDDSVLNHRYNKYVTLSQKFGRKICKTGCMIQRRHEELAAFQYMNLTYGIEKWQPTRVSIPMKIYTSDETPCASMIVGGLIDIPDSPNLQIMIYRKQLEGHWKSKIYKTKDKPGIKSEYVHLTPANKEERKQTDFIVYNEIVEITGEMPEDVLLLYM